jgi:4'-phosphopantetheinyl transferase
MMESLEGKIHVYRLNLTESSAECYQESYRLLDPEERERADRYRHQKSKHAFVRVRSALRVLLGHYLGHPAESVRFDLGEKGKPRLAGTAPNRGLVFNVSHSAEWALIALALDTALGVDVERIRAMTHMEGMAERCLSVTELTWWETLPESQREAAFFSFWSCKEAFVKATGEGITLGLADCVVDVSSHPRLSAIPERCGKAEDWWLDEIPIGEGNCAIVCHQGEPRIIRVADMASYCRGYR